MSQLKFNTDAQICIEKCLNFDWSFLDREAIIVQDYLAENRDETVRLSLKAELMLNSDHCSR